MFAERANFSQVPQNKRGGELARSPSLRHIDLKHKFISKFLNAWGICKRGKIDTCRAEHSVMVGLSHKYGRSPAIHQDAIYLMPGQAPL